VPLALWTGLVPLWLLVWVGPGWDLGFPGLTKIASQTLPVTTGTGCEKPFKPLGPESPRQALRIILPLSSSLAACPGPGLVSTFTSETC
jgi:hypothetical protein